MKIKIPQWASSFVASIVILFLGTTIWSFLVRANITTSPQIPWSFLAMCGILWLSYKYLTGHWWPSSTSSTRKRWSRTNLLSKDQKSIITVASILLGMVIICFLLIGLFLRSEPSGQIAQIERASQYPPITVMALIVMTSFVAGFYEEMALRGYMQKPLEERFGPVAAIAIVAAVFTTLHLPNASFTPVLFIMFLFGSLGWGILAHLSDSILPGIIVHTLVDIIAFMVLWLNIDSVKEISSRNYFVDEVNSTLIILGAITFILILALIFTFFKAYRVPMTGK